MKRKTVQVLGAIFLFCGLLACRTETPDQVISRVEKDYEKEYGSDLVIHREREIYQGLDIYRFTGWTVKDDRKYTEINSDEWIIIFCADKNYQVIKHTAFLPMDSIAKMNNIRCNLN